MHQDDREIGGVSSPDDDSALSEQQSDLLNRINLLTYDAAIYNHDGSVQVGPALAPGWNPGKIKRTRVGLNGGLWGLLRKFGVGSSRRKSIHLDFPRVPPQGQGLANLPTPVVNPPNSGYIYTLKQEYNRLVKKRAELTKSPLSDPMEVLPPDLWPDIIRNIVDGREYPMNKLLDLILVSKGWCFVLTTLPVIWTQIRLEQHEPEYLAKAMMCIQFSGECEIDLNIRNLTLDEWRRISSMIVPEGRRIRRLTFGNDYRFTVIRQVLGDFTKLPVLQELFLPTKPRQLSDQQCLHAIITEKMPSIKAAHMWGCTIQDEIWNPYLTSCSLNAESLTKESVEALMLLPRLNKLTLIETAQTLENIPSLLKSSFGSVLGFTYEGADISRRLTWIGSNLTSISTDYPENGDANAFLVALSCFPHLHQLSITPSSTTWQQPAQNNGHTTSPHNSIRVLHLMNSFPNRGSVDWNMFFSVFFPSSPCLEVLTVRSRLITDIGWNLIQSLKNLRYLKIDGCRIDVSSLIPLNMESLRHLQLDLGSHGLAQLLPRLQSKFLQTLLLTGMQSFPLVDTIPYIVAGAAFPNITSLAITMHTPAILELRMLSKLKVLELQPDSSGNPMLYWANDVLEAILMRPRDNPALEKITLAGMFVKWDILFLMLERRNFLNELGISPIKTLIFDEDLPYRLLYPLSELLGGRFVERDTNQSFSLEAVGKRMWNESLPGCMQCHYNFRGCESLLTPERIDIFLDMATEVHKEYRLVNEYLVADPPLSMEMKLWLSGGRERLSNFMRRYEETGRQLHRRFCCYAWGRSEGSVIAGDVLAGAHFGHDLQVENEITERFYVDSTGED